MKHTCINPPELFNSTEFGFSQIVVAQPGKLVFFSGQVAWDENRQIIGKDNLQLQTEKTFANVMSIPLRLGQNFTSLNSTEVLGNEAFARPWPIRLKA